MQYECYNAGVQLCATQYVCQYAGVCECVVCQAVCDCMPGTAWPPSTAGQSGVPQHPRLQPLSSMLELLSSYITLAYVFYSLFQKLPVQLVDL